MTIETSQRPASPLNQDPGAATNAGEAPPHARATAPRAWRAGLIDDRLHDAAREWHRSLLQPGTGTIIRLAAPAAFGAEVVVVGQSYPSLDGAPSSKLFKVATDGVLTALTDGPGNDIEPLWSPSGERIAFRTTQNRSEGHGAALIDWATGAILPCPPVGGSVEAIAWSSDGTSLLLRVADPGATLASTQGAVAAPPARSEEPGWSPSFDDGCSDPRRRLMVWDRGADSLRAVPTKLNIWEMAAAGLGHAVVVASESATEDAWYNACLWRLDLGSGEASLTWQPERQIGACSASPAGSHIAFVEGLASDRGSLAGDLMIADVQTGEVTRIDTGGADIAWTGWNGDTLYVAGIRGDDTIVQTVDVDSGKADDLAILEAMSAGPRYPAPTLVPQTGALLAVTQSVAQADRLVAVTQAGVVTLASTETAASRFASKAYGGERFQPFSWTASDGEPIDGWLHTPPGPGPFPLVMLVHGGPTARWLPKWIGDMGLGAGLSQLGIAEFYPNPRGSTGRGQAYADAILHDMGGRDALDLLEGIDALVAAGIADPDRLGVTGKSHGGFISSWLITQDRRFKAAVPIAPITDWASQRLSSNIPTFSDRFVGHPGGPLPSPILHVADVTTPVLLIAGAKDRCTPPAQAEHFHRALLLAGKPSTLLVYPEEGHGISTLPAMIDHIARILAFFRAKLLV